MKTAFLPAHFGVWGRNLNDVVERGKNRCDAIGFGGFGKRYFGRRYLYRKIFFLEKPC
jgi:hypothetical protein